MTRGDPDRRCLGGDAGQVAGIEALPFGVLTFVVGSLLVANAWAVVDAKMAVTAAARHAARAYVEAPDEDHGVRRATEAARGTVEGHGRNGDRLELTLEAVSGQGWARCSRIRASASLRVPALTLPWIGGYADGFHVEARHSEIVDPYRAGIASEVRC